MFVLLGENANVFFLLLPSSCKCNREPGLFTCWPEFRESVGLLLLHASKKPYVAKLWKLFGIFYTPSPLLRCLTCTSIYKSCQKALKKFMLRSTFFEIFPDVWPVLKSLQEWIFVGILLLSGHNSIFLHIVNTTKTTTVEGRVIYPLSNLLELAKRPR